MGRASQGSALVKGSLPGGDKCPVHLGLLSACVWKSRAIWAAIVTRGFSLFVSRLYTVIEQRLAEHLGDNSLGC